MNREQIKELLKTIETAPKIFGVIGNERETAINALAKSVPITWFEQFAKMVEQETLEEAANICEANARELVFDDHAQGCRDCAYDIRNLKDNS